MVETKIVPRPPDTDRMARRYRIVGLAFLALPATLVTVLAVAEGVGLESGWWGHAVQIAVVVGVGVLAWMRPKIGGGLLLFVGVAFALHTLLIQSWADPTATLAAVGLVWAPLAVSGGFFLAAGSAES